MRMIASLGMVIGKGNERKRKHQQLQQHQANVFGGGNQSTMEQNHGPRLSEVQGSIAEVYPISEAKERAFLSRASPSSSG